MRRFQRVTVGLSLTASDFDVLRYANLIARLGISREFQFLHVLPEQASAPLQCVEATRRISSLISARFEPYPEDLLVSGTVKVGDCQTQLLDFVRERESRLVLIANRESSGWPSTFATWLARSGACSVWTVPSTAKGRIARILTLVDFSEYSEESLSLAAALARLSDLEECLALHVDDDLSPVFRDLDHRGTSFGEQGLTAFSQFLKSVNTHGQAIIPLMERDADLSKAVVDSIRRQGVDLVVISTTGNGRFENAASRIVAESPVPVLLVQPEAAMRLIEPAGRI